MARHGVLILLVAAIVLCLCFEPVVGKVEKGKYKLKTSGHSATRREVNDYWIYLRKFTYDVGTSVIHGEIKAQKGRRIENTTKLLLYLDEDWAEAESLDGNTIEECEKRESLARVKIDLEYDKQGRTTFHREIKQSIRPHVWFVVAGQTCQIEGTIKEGKVLRGTFRYVMHFVNDNENYLSYEAYGLPTLLFLTLVFSAAISYYAGTLIMKHYKASRGDSVAFHPVTYCFATSLVSHMLSAFLEWWHLRSIASSGYGAGFFHLCSAFWAFVSMASLTLLLVQIGWGWTLTSKTFAETMSSGWGGIFPGLTMVLLFLCQLLAVMAARFQEIDSHVFHEFESRPGKIAVYLYYVNWILFMYGIYSTKTHLSRQAQQFCIQLAVAGSILILCYPISMIIASILAPYVRLKFMACATVIIRSVAIFLLARIFFTRSTYFKLSSLSKSSLDLGGMPSGQENKFNQ